MDLFVPYNNDSTPDFASSTLILVRLVCLVDQSVSTDASRLNGIGQPIVSLANVAQLAADLIIHSLELQRIGCLKSRFHIPLVSPRDYVEDSNVSTSGGRASLSSQGLGACVEGGSLSLQGNPMCSRPLLSVFQSKDSRLTLIQQRSPVIKVRWSLSLF